MSETQGDGLELTGRLLIAMPGMGDPRFSHSVVFMCAHSNDGAMGLIINKALEEVQLADLLRQLSISVPDKGCEGDLYYGGPVEGGRGFVLHAPDYESALQTLQVSDAFSMTATQDVLEDMASNSGPSRSLVALGYSGWGPGQLEGEITQNGWLICDASEALVFDTANADKWAAALQSLGIDPLTLSATAGHA